MDHFGLDCANKTAKENLRPHAEACARRRAIPCTSRAPLAPAPAATPPPASVLKPLALIPPCVGRDIKHQGNVEIPRRTRGETRAMRNTLQEYAHRHGLLSSMDNVALVSMLATLESTNNIVRQHSAPKDSPDLSTAHIPDFSTPSSVFDVEESPHVDWRYSMHREL